MATTIKPRAPIERTEHPHIVKSADTLGGEPRVDGTRISVLQIFRMVEAGTSAQEIVDDFPPLTLAQVYGAVSYAYDHIDEMAHYEEEHKLRTILKKHDLVFVNHRLIPRERLQSSDVPPGAQVYTWETLPENMDE